MKKIFSETEKRKINEKKFWEKRASSYDKQVKSFSSEYEYLKTKIKSYTNKDSFLLDVACGTGILALDIAPYVGNVCAVDISSNMVDVAKKKEMQAKVNNIEIAVADAYELPFSNEVFDVVLLANLLHVVKEPAVVVREARRVLKKNGYILVSTACFNKGEESSKSHFSLLKLVKTLGIIRYLNFYKKNDVDTIIRDAGFEIIDSEYISESSSNYFISSKKTR